MYVKGENDSIKYLNLLEISSLSMLWVEVVDNEIVDECKHNARTYFKILLCIKYFIKLKLNTMCMKRKLV